MGAAGRRAPAEGLAGFAATLPLVLFVTLVAVEFAFWLHAQGVVMAAAQEGARVAAREDGTAAEGERTARALLEAGLGASAGRVGLVVQVGDDLVAVDAWGTWPVLVALDGAVSAPLHAQASVTRERFRPFGQP